MNKIYSLTKELVKMQTTENKPHETENSLKLIKKKFSNVFYIKEFNYRKRPMLVLSNSKRRKVDIIFAGHVDVVPANEINFKLSEKGKRIFARGVYDMKGPLAALLFAVKDYLKESNKLKITIFITTDEEIDGLSTKYLVKEKRYRAKFAILPDGGSENKIVTRQKGFLQIKISTKGEGAHAATPWKAKNPILNGILLYNTLLKKFPQPKNINDWKTTISLTKIHTGKAINQIPTEAEIYFDIRYINNKDKDRILILLKKYTNKNITFDIIGENSPLFVDHNIKYLQILKKVIRKNVKKNVKFIRECGTSDAVFFTESNIPAVLFSPIGSGAHSDSEWIDKNSLIRFYKIIINFLNELSN